jgi:drug/metabolite transporter (DMT)-like permease
MDRNGPTPSGVPLVMNERADRLAIGAGLVTVVLWSSAFVGIRAVVADYSPGSIALGRLLVGSIALGVLVAVRPWTRPSRRDLALIAASGLTWFAFYNLALNEAERNVDAGTAAMLVNMGPIFLALLAGLFLGEGFPPRLLIGCAIGLAGTAVIGLTTTSGGVAGDTTLGIVLCLLAALAYAVGVTLQKPALRHVPAIEVTWIACLVGMLVCLPFAPNLVEQVSTADPVSTAWLVYLGLFPTTIAFTTWAFALRRMPAGHLGSMTYLIPPVVIGLSWLLLAEAPTLVAIAGGALCIAGVIVARSTGRPWSRRMASPQDQPSVAAGQDPSGDADASGSPASIR